MVLLDVKYLTSKSMKETDKVTITGKLSKAGLGCKEVDRPEMALPHWYRFRGTRVYLASTTRVWEGVTYV